MKKILGLDLGTNSIGAALINMPENIADFGKKGNIEWVGSRILPMDKFIKTSGSESKNPLSDFSSGIGISKAAARRQKRSSRRNKQRYKLRRTRLIMVFKTLGWLDDGFPENFKKEMKDENFIFQISKYLPFSEETTNEATKLLGSKNKSEKLVLSEDWIIYYLRKKALIEKITIAELCRITYMMNQRRGFKSSRKDLKDENLEEVKWVEKLKIISITQETFEPNKNKNFKFKISVDNPRIEPWFIEKKKKPEWEGKEYTFLITEKIETKKDGTKKVTQNNPQIPKEGDWALCVTAQDNQIGDEYPGTYFFNGLASSAKNKTDFKIRQYAVYRKKYKKELEDIWKKQIELNEDLQKISNDKTTLQKLAHVLYPTQSKTQKPKLNEILNNSLLHLISDDIIYYQRDLKSQKNSRGECQYEKHKGIDGETYGVNCAPKSSPKFQEMRIWQDIHNIKILKKEAQEIIEGKTYTKVDIDVTYNFIDDSVKEKLFVLFDSKTEITQQDIFNEINKLKLEAKLDVGTYRINMFFDIDKKLKGNETKEYFRKIFRKKENNYTVDGEKLLNDKDKFYKLWNISYSISLNDEEQSKNAIFKALTATNNKRKKANQITFNLPPEIAKAIASAPEIESSKKYASYSSKAINKLLPMMRCGNMFDEKIISDSVKQRADEIKSRLETINFNPKRIHEIADDDVQKQLLKSFINKRDDMLKGLNTYQACYLMYDRHSERVDDKKYLSPSEFNIMKLLPNNSLRNPVVEQVIRETLFVVKDVWEKYGQPDEIHIEMGRDLKKNAKERENATKSSKNNYEEKQQIKKLLYELMNGFEQYENIEDDKDKVKKVNTKFDVKPNPNNPSDIDRFRIWKNTSGLKDFEFEKKVKEEKIPKNQEIKKYALWLSQKCVSPYTGMIIPLSKLFDQSYYEIEHVLPKAKIKNDSFDNLVISERGVNKAKGKDLAAIFIKNKNGGCEYEGRKYKLLNYDSFVAHCKTNFRGKKLQNLLATEIPEDFITRQINDTRYITKKISEILFPVAKDKTKGIVFTIGAITSELKKEWGLQKEWKKLIKPRFERLEKLNNAEYILQNQKDKNDIDFHIPENPDLDTKRIDHRHHALDAIIIAATTSEHIKYLNTLSAADTDEDFKKARTTLVKSKIREWQLPWAEFTRDTKEKLEETIVTFKSNNKVIDKPKNIYKKWNPIRDNNGIQKFSDTEKQIPLYELASVKQEANPNWMSVRQSLFKEPQGLINIKEIILRGFRTPNERLEIFKLQIKRNDVQNTPAQKTTAYIYDQHLREKINQIIELSGANIEAIENYLKKAKILDENNEPIHSIRIAEFNKYAAKRVMLNKDFDHKKIDKIPYSEKYKNKIPQTLHQHLKEFEDFDNLKKSLEEKKEQIERGVDSTLILNDYELKILNTNMPEPFSDEGLEALDKKVGMKIRMVTIKEEIGLKKQLKNKLAEADGNPFYIIQENLNTKERSGYTSISSFDYIQQLKEGKPIAEAKKNCRVIILQTDDLVYVPTKNEIEEIKNGGFIVDSNIWLNRKKIVERIYRVNNFTESEIYFKPSSFSKAIKAKELHTSFDDKCSRLIVTPTKDNEGNDITEEAVMIKEVCIKIKVDRLGNIKIF